jgi:16S rRNA (uracil1498-N3)-methyltransferase
LWPQLAALGVGRVLVTNAERVERFYFDAHALDPAHYRPLLIEGLAQAKDTLLPEVTVHKRLKVMIEDELDSMIPEARRFVADPSYTRSVWDAIASGPCPRVLLALGPEGGWTPYERDMLERHGFAGVGLGTRTLRSDTAAIAMVALAHQALAAGPR